MGKNFFWVLLISKIGAVLRGRGGQEGAEETECQLWSWVCSVVWESEDFPEFLFS